MNPVSEKSPLVFIPNLYHNAFNLEYRRDMCSWSFHYSLREEESIFLQHWKRRNQTHYFILAESGVVVLPFVSSAYVIQKKSTYCLTDFFTEKAWVCSTPPSFLLVMEKSHLCSEIANQPDNHHTEIAAMKIKQCYIWSLNHVYL